MESVWLLSEGPPGLAWCSWPPLQTVPHIYHRLSPSAFTRIPLTMPPPLQASHVVVTEVSLLASLPMGLLQSPR